ncbi:hypothetical protein [Halocola ammonii]
MPVDHTEIKQAVHAILNDVVEQCFQYMVHCPEHSEELNKIITEASADIRSFSGRIDQFVDRCDEMELKQQLSFVSKELHKKSLIHLSRLQRIQQSVVSNGDSERNNQFFDEEDE